MKYPFLDNSHSLWLQNPTTHMYPELTDSDPFDVDAFATHHMPLEEAPEAYEMFQKKEQGAVKSSFIRRYLRVFPIFGEIYHNTANRKGLQYRGKHNERGACMLNVIAWIVVGGLAGWVASKIMKTDASMGVILNVVVGIIGALIGGWVVNLLLDADPAIFSIGGFLTAVLGAVILLAIVRAFSGRRPAPVK